MAKKTLGKKSLRVAELIEAPDAVPLASDWFPAS